MGKGDKENGFEEGPNTSIAQLRARARDAERERRNQDSSTSRAAFILAVCAAIGLVIALLLRGKKEKVKK